MFERKEPEFKFNLGSKVKDILTGFTGILECRSQWLHNCNTYGIKPSKLNKDGEPARTQYFDEPQLILVEENVVEPKRDTGGPCKDIPQTNPVRIL